MLEMQNTPTGPTWFSSPLLSQIGLPHAFSTRIGGVSDGPFASLNLGNPAQSPLRDTDANIAENYRRLLTAIGRPEGRLCRVHQVHSAEIILIRSGQDHDNSRQADAIITSDPGVVASVRTADCVPILIGSRDGRWVAAVHAGWRGVVTGILPAVLTRLMRETNLVAADFVVAIGPCISGEAFEVGPEVTRQFERAFPARPPITRRVGEKAFIDLPDALLQQALAAGVPQDQIETTTCCTYRDQPLFFSHRRDHGLTGRMAAVISPLVQP